MRLFDASPLSGESSPIESREELVARYRRLRAVSRTLNSALVRRLSGDAMEEGGTKLGILRDGVLTFGTEDESSVLMDYCLYDVRRGGRNAVEQYLLDSPPDPRSDEMTCLRAMQQAYYSVFVVESVERGLGVTARDLRTNDVLRIVDLGYGDSAIPGLAFASRILPFDGFSVMSGASLPLGMLSADRREAVAKTLAAAIAPGSDGRCDPAGLIRECLASGRSAHVRYRDVPGSAAARRRTPTITRSVTPGRNAPCPCGSGKKFKHCCITRG